MRAATAADLPAMLELLRGKDLPVAGVADHLERYILEFADGQLLGYAGSELHGSAALLRSVAVNAEQRSSGVGAQLVRAQLEAAKNLNATSVSLLTTTANTDSVKSLHLFLRTDCVQQRRKPVRCWCQRQERNP